MTFIVARDSRFKKMERRLILVGGASLAGRNRAARVEMDVWAEWTEMKQLQKRHLYARFTGSSIYESSRIESVESKAK